MSPPSAIGQYISIHAEKIEQELMKVFPSDWNVPVLLREAMIYSLMAAGKRIRPILVLAATEALNGSVEAAMPAAVAIEMIHTYSLIHDDLPAMDNDDYRRDKLTNHKVYGEALAILAGDALLTHAFFSLSQASRMYGIPTEQTLAIIEELSVLAGAKGMVGGQAADMLGDQGLTNLQELEYIHLRKTSDLIVFSLRAGGRVAGANETQLEALTRFGTSIGLAFQIQDDILDLTGDQQNLGKSVKSDERQQKVTFPYFIGLEASQEKVRLLTKEGKRAILDSSIPNPQRLLQLADFLLSRER